MRRLMIAAAGLGLLLGTKAASAKGGMNPQVQAMMNCRSVTPDAERLACYDRSMAEMQQALSKGSLVLKESRGPKALEGVVRESGERAENRYWVILDSGDRWDLLPNDTRRGPPAPGTTLTIRRALMGNYWAKGPGWGESEADFIPARRR